MAARLMAYADLMDAVVQYSGNNPNQQSVQNTNRAASAAYLGLVRAHDWSFYKRVFSVPTHAGYSTGTVTYDHTGGGTCERQLTLAGGTWPTWAAYGYVQIAMKTYQVQKYYSATVIQLAENNNPGDDITDASEYSLYRDMYPLPLDFANCYNAVTQPSGVQLTYVPIAMWAYGRDYYLNASRPVAFTVTQDLVVPQRQAVRFWPAPNEAYSVLFTYKADLVHPSYRKVVDGSVTLTASSATVTGTGTKFESGMAGALLRVSRAGDPTLPTGIEGESPAYAEYVIDSVQSETSLTLQDTAAGSLARVKYSISSLLDVEPFATREYLFRECERQYRRLARMAVMPGEAMEWQRSLDQAKDADSRYAGWKGSSPWAPRLTIWDVATLPYSTS
jgi:hypothetical protein